MSFAGSAEQGVTVAAPEPPPAEPPLEPEDIPVDEPGTLPHVIVIYVVSRTSFTSHYVTLLISPNSLL